MGNYATALQSWDQYYTILSYYFSVLVQIQFHLPFLNSPLIDMICLYHIDIINPLKYYRATCHVYSIWRHSCYHVSLDIVHIKQQQLTTDILYTYLSANPYKTREISTPFIFSILKHIYPSFIHTIKEHRRPIFNNILYIIYTFQGGRHVRLFTFYTLSLIAYQIVCMIFL